LFSSNNNDMFSDFSLEKPVFRSVYVAEHSSQDDFDPTEEAMDMKNLGLDGPVFRGSTVGMHAPAASVEYDFWASVQQEDDTNGNMSMDIDADLFDAPELTQKLHNKNSSMFQHSLHPNKQQQILPDVPCWVEKYYCSFSLETASNITELVCAFLSFNKMSHKQIHQHVVQGICEVGGKFCDFSINLYHWNNDKASCFGVEPLATSGKGENSPVLVEVSRQGGCAVIFSDFYRRLTAAIAPIVCRKFVVFPSGGNSPLSSSSSTNSTPTPVSFAPVIPPSQFHLDAQSTKSLLNMTKSPNLQVRQQGISALASATKCAEGKKKFFTFLMKFGNTDVNKEELAACGPQECPAIDFICQALDSMDDTFRRKGAQILANVVDSMEGKDVACASKVKIVNALAGSIAQVSSQTTLRDSETKSTICGMFEQISDVCASTLSTDEEAAKVFAAAKIQLRAVHCPNALNSPDPENSLDLSPM
jgi:hypothetical protein